MRVRQLSFLLIFLTQALKAQDVNPGSRLASMGNAAAALQDVWSVQSNPAGIASLPRPVASVTYKKNFPGTSLSTQAGVFVCPVKTHVFGLAFQNFGFSDYSEMRLGFAYARRFGTSVQTALEFNYHQLSINSYGSKGTFSINAGFQYKPAKELVIGAYVSNLSNASYDHGTGAVIPVELSVGVAYYFSEELLWAASVWGANHSSGADFRTGIEYCVLRQLAFRAGIGLRPLNQYAGLGYKIKHVEVDLAVSNHNVLGYTPQISLAYVF